MAKIKYTAEMVDERFAKMVEQSPKKPQGTPQGKPNVLDVIRGKKERRGR